VQTDSIEIRTLRSNEDCQAAADFQREIWGNDYVDIVPGTLLHVVDYVGGLAAGAFDAGGELLGFVFGMNGIRDGDLVHWSHMLGVRESARNSGIGRMLKEYQRTTLAAIGVKRIYWTFDPLMSKNAYFNINRLGAEIVEYVPDMYGRTSSPLHLGLPTDRLIACLPTTPREGVRRPEPNAGTPVLTAFPKLEDHTVSVRDHAPDVALIEIPADILDVLARSPTAAQTWRLAVRDHFQWALSHGYTVTGVHRDAAANRSFFVVSASRTSGRGSTRGASVAAALSSRA
jgi:predicted GNAT superfamily acetyltransferase